MGNNLVEIRPGRRIHFLENVSHTGSSRKRCSSESVVRSISGLEIIDSMMINFFKLIA